MARRTAGLTGYRFSCPLLSLSWKEMLDTLHITDLFFLCDALPCKNVVSIWINNCFLMHYLEGNSIHRQCLLLSCREVHFIQVPLKGCSEWALPTGVLGAWTAHNWVLCRHKFE